MVGVDGGRHARCIDALVSVCSTMPLLAVCWHADAAFCNFMQVDLQHYQQFLDDWAAADSQQLL